MVPTGLSISDLVAEPLSGKTKRLDAGKIVPASPQGPEHRTRNDAAGPRPNANRQSGSKG